MWTDAVSALGPLEQVASVNETLPVQQAHRRACSPDRAITLDDRYELVQPLGTLLQIAKSDFAWPVYGRIGAANHIEEGRGIGEERFYRRRGEVMRARRIIFLESRHLLGNHVLDCRFDRFIERLRSRWA